jgi:large subunit ribosomal protein L3
MIDGLIGRKVGMTQVFEPDGTVIPVTVITAGPCVIVQLRSKEHDRYESAQVGLVEKGAGRNVNKPIRGHFEKAKVPPTRVLREFKLEKAEAKVGDTVVASIFAPNDQVDVVGLSKGHGFTGVMARHNFSGGAASHGSMFHRAPGSIGASAWPSRTFPGMRGAGRHGGARITVRNLKIVRVDAERNLIAVRGAVPGPAGTYLTIRRTKVAKRTPAPAPVTKAKK